MVQKCPSCGTEFAEVVRFCSNCGAEITDKQSKRKRVILHEQNNNSTSLNKCIEPNVNDNIQAVTQNAQSTLQQQSCNFCVYCGTVLPLDAAYCEMCGKPVIAAIGYFDTADVCIIGDSNKKISSANPIKKIIRINKQTMIITIILMFIIMIGSFLWVSKGFKHPSESIQNDSNSSQILNNDNTNIKDESAGDATASTSEGSPKNEKQNSQIYSNQPEDEKDQALSTFMEYLKMMPEAVNSGNVDKIKKFMTPDTQFYNQQINLVSRLHKKSIHEELLDANVQYNFNENKDLIMLNVFEKHRISYPDGSNKIVDGFYIYMLDPVAPYKIHSIVKNNNPEERIIIGECIVTSDNADLFSRISDENCILGYAKSGGIYKITGRTYIEGASWVRILHPKYGICWLKAENISENVPSVSVNEAQQSSQKKPKSKQTSDTVPVKQSETKNKQTQSYEMPPDTSAQTPVIQPKEEYEMP